MKKKETDLTEKYKQDHIRSRREQGRARERKYLSDSKGCVTPDTKWCDVIVWRVSQKTSVLLHSALWSKERKKKNITVFIIFLLLISNVFFPLTLVVIINNSASITSFTLLLLWFIAIMNISLLSRWLFYYRNCYNHYYPHHILLLSLLS